MAIPLYQDLWNGKETLSETVALRCGEKQLTFGDFFQNILRAEAGLRSLGVGPGDLVTLITLNTPEAVIAFYAIDRIGAVANWVDTKLSPTEGRLGIGVGLCQGVSKPRPGSGGTFYYVAVGLLSSGCFGGKASFEHLAGSGGSWLYALGIFASNTTRYFP